MGQLNELTRTILADEPEVLRACMRAKSLAPPERAPDLPPSRYAPDVPGWHAFEDQAWAIGESIRQALLKNKLLRKSSQVQESLVSVVEAINLGRGRQSFLFSLENIDARPVAYRLAPFLSDPDVQGHVLSALLKMKAPGFKLEVAPLLNSKFAWIRRKARTYMERFPE